MEEDQNNTPEAGLPAILTSDKLLAIAEQAEKRVDALNKIKLIALRATNAHDWTDHQGKPWLQESGATKVGRLFGVTWKIVGPELETYEDGHFNYTYQGIFKLADIPIDAIGSRQSKDGFFNTRYKWDDVKKKMMPKDVPPSEIDKGDVKKAAWANCLARGITTILGIKNLTWEEIEQHTNIRKNDVTSIMYNKGKEKGKKGPKYGSDSPLGPPATSESQKGAKKQGKPADEGNKPATVGDSNVFIHCPRHGKEIIKKACPPCEERQTCESWSEKKKEPDEPSAKEEAEDPTFKFTGLKPRAFKKVFNDNIEAIPGMAPEHQDIIKAEWEKHFSGQPFPVVIASDKPPEDKPKTELSLEEREAAILKFVEGAERDDMRDILVPCPNRQDVTIKYSICDICMYNERVGCPTWVEFDKAQ